MANIASPAPAEAAAYNLWTKVEVPFEDTVYDIDFDSADHGYLVGARGAFAETNDGGKTCYGKTVGFVACAETDE